MIPGSILIVTDEHGNKRFEAKSIHGAEVITFWTRSAATYWIEICDDIVRSRRFRLGAAA